MKGTIVYIGGFELPDKNAAAHRVIGNAKIFRDLGYDVKFIGTDSDTSKISEKKNTQGFDYYSLPYPRSKKEWLSYITNPSPTIAIINQIKDVKMIIAYNYPAVSLSRINKYCKSKNIKLIADCTEWYNTGGGNIIFKLIKGFDTGYRMKYVQKKLDGLIAISSLLENYYKDSTTVVRIPPLVDTKEEKWHQDKYQKNGEELRFVYVGSPGITKDRIDKVLEWLDDKAKDKDFIFDIIGITKDQYLSNFPDHKDIVKSLENKVVFRGRLSHLEGLRYLKSADFSIFLREKNLTNQAGFPTKFVESISSGTPIITTSTSDISEYLKDGINGFYFENDDFSLDKVIKLNRADIQKMKDYCSFNNPFSYENYVDDAVMFLREI